MAHTTCGKHSQQRSTLVQFKQAGAAVIVTGRSEDRLRDAADKLEGVTYYVNNVAGGTESTLSHAAHSAPLTAGIMQTRSSGKSCMHESPRSTQA